MAEATGVPSMVDHVLALDQLQHNRNRNRNRNRNVVSGFSRTAVVGFFETVDRRDVRMIEGREQLRDRWRRRRAEL